MAVTLKGIEQAISGLDYRNPNTPKARLLSAMADQYRASEQSEISSIAADRLIDIMWALNGESRTIRSRRKNFSSVKSSVNADLDVAWKEGRNPEGLAIGPDNTFVMSDAAKDKLLNAFGDSMSLDGSGALERVAEALKIVTDYLSSASTDLVPQQMESLKSLVRGLSEKIMNGKTGEMTVVEKGADGVVEFSAGPGKGKEAQAERGQEATGNRSEESPEAALDAQAAPGDAADDFEVVEIDPDEVDDEAPNDAEDEAALPDEDTDEALEVVTDAEEEGLDAALDAQAAPGDAADDFQVVEIDPDEDVLVEYPDAEADTVGAEDASDVLEEAEVLEGTDDASDHEVVELDTLELEDGVPGEEPEESEAADENMEDVEAVPEDFEALETVDEVTDVSPEDLEELEAADEALLEDGLEDVEVVEDPDAEADTVEAEDASDVLEEAEVLEGTDDASDHEVEELDTLELDDGVPGEEPEESEAADENMEDAEAVPEDFEALETVDEVTDVSPEDLEELEAADEALLEDGLEDVEAVEDPDAEADTVEAEDASDVLEEAEVLEGTDDASDHEVEELDTLELDDGVPGEEPEESEAADENMEDVEAVPEDFEALETVDEVTDVSPEDLEELEAADEALLEDGLEDVEAVEDSDAEADTVEAEDASDVLEEAEVLEGTDDASDHEVVELDTLELDDGVPGEEPEESEAADENMEDVEAVPEDFEALETVDEVTDVSPEDLEELEAADEALLEDGLEDVEVVEDPDAEADTVEAEDASDVLEEAEVLEGTDDASDHEVVELDTLELEDGVPGEEPEESEAADENMEDAEAVPEDFEALETVDEVTDVSPEDLEELEAADEALLEDGLEDVEVVEDPDEELEEVELAADEEAGLDQDDPFAETQSTEGRSDPEIGLPFDDFADEGFQLEDFKADAEQKKLLAERFDGYLGAMERYFNQYILIPKGRYTVGSEKAEHDILPLDRINLPEFYMGQFPVTNALFEIFVERTGYTTTAEKCGYGYVYYGRFRKTTDPGTGRVRSTWNPAYLRKKVQGATWYQPTGPGSNLHKKRNHPVVQVSIRDARTFASWTGKRLPTEAEWEAAARTISGLRYPWGEEWKENVCNLENAGISDTSPVDGYPEGANPNGLYDLMGNVMEWTSDRCAPKFDMDVEPDTYVAKSSAWMSHAPMDLTFRSRFDASFTSNVLGFRCVAD